MRQSERRTQGLAGAIGITGHGDQAPATHREALNRFPFATVLTPLNPVLARDSAYLADYEGLVEEVQRQDVGLMIIKTAARRNWPDGAEHTYTTWYEPFDEQSRITATVAWVLARPEVTGIATPSDVRLLSLVVRAEAERGGLLPGTAEAALRDEPNYSSPFVDIPF